MHECEVWIDVECTATEPAEVVCTLFGRQKFQTRPLMNENLSFATPKGSDGSYRITMTWGPMQTSGASTEIEEVSHYRAPKSENLEFTTALRCRPVRVPSLEDARILVQLLTQHHGFELDPYGTNKLNGASAA
jgi:hypothetical protein